MQPVTLTLSDNRQNFVQWLASFTALVHLQFFPLSQGGCTLQKAQLAPQKTVSPTTKMEDTVIYAMDAFYWDGLEPRSGAIHPHPQAIQFSVTGNEPCTLTITCHYSPVQAYLHDLLVGMVMRWPEIQPQISALDILSASETDLTLSIWDWPGPGDQP